jgi:hypothetical protein
MKANQYLTQIPFHNLMENIYHKSDHTIFRQLVPVKKHCLVLMQNYLVIENIVYINLVIDLKQIPNNYN